MMKRRRERCKFYGVWMAAPSWRWAEARKRESNTGNGKNFEYLGV